MNKGSFNFEHKTVFDPFYVCVWRPTVLTNHCSNKLARSIATTNKHTPQLKHLTSIKTKTQMQEKIKRLWHDDSKIRLRQYLITYRQNRAPISKLSINDSQAR